MRNQNEAHMFHLARELEKTWRCSCWEKGKFILIPKFKYRKPQKFVHLHLGYRFTVPLRLPYVSVIIEIFSTLDMF